MKPLGIKNYGSIPHMLGSKLGQGDHHIHEGQHKILTEKARKGDTILVTEKYDGSNVGIAKKDGKIYALTRSGYEAHTSPYEQHHVFSGIVNSQINTDAIPEGYRFVGEWLWVRHSLAYKIQCEIPLIIFDAFDANNKRVLREELESYDLGLPFSRLLHKGDPISCEDSMELVNNPFGIFYTPKPEGVVYRVENERGVDFLAKFVRSDFESRLPD